MSSSSPGTLPPVFEILIIAAVLLLIAGGVMYLVWGVQRFRENRQEAEEAELAFLESAEREMAAAQSGKSAGIGAGTAAAVSPAPSAGDESFQPAPAESPGAVLGAGLGAGLSAAAGATDVLSEGFEEFVANLRRLGVIEAMEGKVDLPPPAPPAPVFRLRSGGHALILDDWESERFIAHQARRFRFIIIRGTAGQAVVVRRYEDFLTDAISGAENWGRS